MMNHPFPLNLPILREIYAGRFSQVVFLMPFARVPDPDVITVYRGSYAHAAYLTDAAAQLMALDCDFFLVVHDDVMLNPRLDERSFSTYFPIGESDAYISTAVQPHINIGHRAWYYASLPRMLYPQSMMLGAGVNPANAAKYLPSVEEIARKLDSAGVSYRTEVQLNDSDFADIERNASRILLNGHVTTLSAGAAQTEVEARCLELERRLVDVMAADQAQAHPDRPYGNAPLPFPILDAGCHADLYVLPKSRFGDFIHYIGVAAASGVFVEIAVPVLLYTVCERVWTAEELGLDTAFFDDRNSILSFDDPKLLAIHPFKLSYFQDPAFRRALISMVHAFAEGRSPWPPQAAPGDYPFNPLIETAGWHPVEVWGRWASRNSSSIDFSVPPGAVKGLRLGVTAPLNEHMPVAAGQVHVNGRFIAQVEITGERPMVEVVIDACEFPEGAATRVELLSDRLLVLKELDPGSDDGRALGLGLAQCCFF